MKVIIVEGTPQEISEAFPDLNMRSAIVSTPTAPSSVPTVSSSKDDDGVSYVTAEVARKVLSRRKLSKEQLEVLRAIYKAHPGTVLGTELQALIGYSRPQFSGLMGAMGRRYTHTEGFVEGAWFFEQEWDDAGATYRYGLPETVREAMRLEKLV